MFRLILLIGCFVNVSRAIHFKACIGMYRVRTVWRDPRVGYASPPHGSVFSDFNRYSHRPETILTSGGSLRGEEVKIDGIQFKSFKGIPYAAPPLGNYRFKDPQPAEIWEDIIDAVQYGHICHQANMVSDLSEGGLSNIEGNMSTPLNDQNEDCLTLNVYTKKLGKEAAQPVLFSIHGGGFFSGDGTDEMFGPAFLVEQDLVVVTFNYRVGPLGFLATNTSDASGNWGLKDQAAALKWVQENIAQFGGDPKQVTIYGQSSGGSSVHFHMLSPLSKGLFQKAIAASGSALNNWAVTDQQERFSKNLARVLGAPESEIEDSGRRVQFLRKISAKRLTEQMLYALEDEDFQNGIVATNPFPPVVEPADTEGAFILETPRNLVADGNFAKVPTMMGFTDLEGGLLNMGFSEYTTPDARKKLDAEPCGVLPRTLRVAVEAKGDCDKVSQQIKDVYFRGKGLDSSQLGFTLLFGDLAIVNGVHLAQKWHAKFAKQDNPVYYYYFTYDGEWNMAKKLFDIKLPGAVHGDDVSYVFKPRIMKLPFKEPTATGVKTKERMVSFIVNFVKQGNPTPAINDLAPIKWEAAKENELNTLHIDGDIKMEKEILKGRMDLWDNLYKNYLNTSIYN